MARDQDTQLSGQTRNLNMKYMAQGKQNSKMKIQQSSVSVSEKERA